MEYKSLIDGLQENPQCTLSCLRVLKHMFLHCHPASLVCRGESTHPKRTVVNSTSLYLLGDVREVPYDNYSTLRGDIALNRPRSVSLSRSLFLTHTRTRTHWKHLPLRMRWHRWGDVSDRENVIDWRKQARNRTASDRLVFRCFFCFFSTQDFMLCPLLSVKNTLFPQGVKQKLEQEREMEWRTIRVNEACRSGHLSFTTMKHSFGPSWSAILLVIKEWMHLS